MRSEYESGELMLKPGPHGSNRDLDEKEFSGFSVQ